MARNKYDVDETLETPFSLHHFKRSLVYVAEHKKKMIAALSISAAGTLFGLLTPLLTKYALDVSIPNGNIPQLLLVCAAVLLCIVTDVLMARKRAYMMAEITQAIIYEIRMDLFAHLQKLPFSYYDNRPHGKILVRVVSYVNNISDMLSNGLVTFVMDVVNIVFIALFMMLNDWRLGLVILAGVPLLVLAFCVLLGRRVLRVIYSDAPMTVSILALMLVGVLSYNMLEADLFLSSDAACFAAYAAAGAVLAYSYEHHAKKPGRHEKPAGRHEKRPPAAG